MGFDGSVERRGKEDTPAKRAVVVAHLAQASAVGAAMYFTDHCWRRKNEQERNKLSRMLREIFGPLPFRSLTLDPAWLTWHDGLLVSMAQRMYDSRDFTDMPILADALEESGCSNQDILAHCRSGGEHVRGCWVIDLLLGKS
jgi:hypothetical protein